MNKITLFVLLGLAMFTASQDFITDAETSSVENGSTCGGNCPSGTCNTCYCGTSAEYDNIASACSQYSGWS